jgi:acyl-coenzyme A thioesterase PaaI-like protein
LNSQTAIQDLYPEELGHCFGCGSHNPAGHQLKSYWNDAYSVARFTPQPSHTAIPGFVYGGLIASLIDCHGTATASAAAYRVEARDMGTAPVLRFVTASLKVDYLAPTPVGVELELRGIPLEIKGRKVIVAITVLAGDTICARGQVIAVRMPDSMLPARK